MTVAAAGGESNSRESSLRLAMLLCGIDMLLIGIAAWSSNSVTILSDAFKEAADFVAVLAALLTVRAVRQAPSERFAYGVGKLENLVSMAIGALMVGCGIFILYRALDHLSDPQPTEGTLPGIVLFSVYAIIGFAMWVKNKLALRSHYSAILMSQAHLWLSKAVFDMAMAAALIAALVLREHAWSMYIDPVAALVGVGFLFHGAWAITSSSVGDLLDATLEETMQLLILRSLVDHFDEYEQIHAFRTRRSGPRVYVEAFLEFDPQLRMEEVTQRIKRLSASISQAVPGADVIITPVPPT